VTDGTVHCHFICQTHGLVALSSVIDSGTRRFVTCPKCGAPAELWLGTTHDRNEMMFSVRSKRRPRR